jgi:excinuclease ABC subunit A
LQAAGIRNVIEVDSTPIGRNARSTPATYSGVFDLIRPLFSHTEAARRRKWNAGHFSYNVAAGRCPTCEGLGELSLDVQYLPDVPVLCPDCGGRRFSPETLEVTWNGRSIADILELSIEDAVDVFADEPRIRRILSSLVEVGLGYLVLGEPTPALSGGEAQRLRLASELRKGQDGMLFIFDEPSIGLHPLDVETLLGVFDQLVAAEATIIVIEHDLGMIANADWIVDIGPGGGDHGGRIVATGTPTQIRREPQSSIGVWLDRHLARRG